ncbi:MAG: NAD(P)H-dependent oxidoreductase [Salinivirgaceae bacterium]|nr:NAD(P)H-dependent oxidoreductase [Salinivirgaceae bacterium]
MVACSSTPKKAEPAKPKALVIYYSQSNTTRTVAQEIQKQLNCDIAEIECVEPYTGDFGQTIQRWQKEQQEGTLPEVKPLAKNISDYDVIFLGYPIWGGSYAPPVASLLKTTDFGGKKLVPFCTFGSGGLNTSVTALQQNAQNAQIQDGYGIRQARIANAPAEVEQFLIKGGFKEGELEQLPDFSAQAECTDAEKEIFTQATSGYQFPLGTPASVGSRPVKGGTEYLFNVEGQGGAKSQIYVLAKENEKPEFTQVVR